MKSNLWCLAGKKYLYVYIAVNLVFLFKKESTHKDHSYSLHF